MMHAHALGALLALFILWPSSARCQALSATAAAGPVLLPGAATSADWAGLVAVGLQHGHIGVRLEGMYTGVPGADLGALTANLVWSPRAGRPDAFKPYLIAGAGSYLKITESRFGLNAGVGVRRKTGPIGLMAEVRYHRVTRRFDEAPSAATFIPILIGVTVGR